MSFVNACMQEIAQEGKTTRRVLERVPADKLTWRPHPKSMSLGQLALHVAASPGVVCEWVAAGGHDFAGGEGAPQPSSAAEILGAHDESMQKAQSIISDLGDEGLRAEWTGRAGELILMAMPKAALVRTIVLNHWYHHRGQLSVYLRLLDVPVPPIYGPSADENPFAARAQAEAQA